MTDSDFPTPIWVTSDQQLKDACERWQQEEFLALDTEFVRTSTFYPQAGLVQLADSYHCYLIDPLTVEDWSPFSALLSNPNICMVFHSCAEDLEVCRRLTGVIPAKLADSQLAAAMVGLGASLGFQRLVSVLLGLELGKEATRSNWLARPLSEEQIQYAVADVFYLRKIFPLLRDRLQQMGRLDWMYEDGVRQLKDAGQEPDASDYYRRVKLAWKLRPQELYLLQVLCIWREGEARNRDVPRNKVVDDSSLWNIARYKSKNRDQLFKAGLKSDALRLYGEGILSLVKQSLEQSSDYWPDNLDRPLSPEAGQWLKAVRAFVSSEAEKLNIPPEVLARKKPLEQLVRSGYYGDGFALPEVLAGWRRQAIGDNLIQQLEQISDDPDAFFESVDQSRP